MSHNYRPLSHKPAGLHHALAAPCRRIMAVAADIRSSIGRMMEHRRQRRALARLDQRLLNDIGLSREAVQEEIQRPFWH